MPRRMLAFIFVLLLLVLGSCSAGPAGPESLDAFGVLKGAPRDGARPDKAAPALAGDPLPAGLSNAQLPDLPTERETTGLTKAVIDGSNTYQRSPGALDQDTACRLNASGHIDGMEWALYRFQPTATQELISLDIDFELQLGAGAWVALSDYAQQRWQLSGPLLEAGSFTLDDAVHRSPMGNFYCAVLAPAGSRVLVNSLSLHIFDPENSLPSAELAPWEISGTAPLQVYFNGEDSDPGGDEFDSIVEFAWDWEDDGNFDRLGPDGLQSHSFTEPGSYQVRLRVSDSAGGQAEDLAVVLVNAPPVAQIQFAAEIESGFETTLDGSASSDPDGTIVRYEWDGDGDGSFETDSGSTSSIQVTFPTGGERTVLLRVTDDFGAQALTAANLTVSGWSGGKTLESVNYCGHFSNLMYVDGLPAIAFHEATSHDVRYMRSLDVEGAQWGPSIAVDVSGFVGVDLSMAIVDGFPALSYQDAEAGTLRYLRALDAQGSTWGQSKVLDTQGYTGRTTSIAVVDGKPAISYSRLGGPLLFIRAVDSTGELWDNPIALDNAGFFTVATSLEIVDNAPAVAYSVNDQLRYVRATDSSGTAWGIRLILAQTNNGDGGCSLRVLNGVPAIAFNHVRNSVLAFVRSSDATGSSWEQVQFLDTSGGLGTDCCLRLIGGLPAVSYFEDDAGDLRFVMALDGAGVDWEEPQVLDSTGNTGRWSSMMDLAGTPLISYFDEGLGDLRLIRLVP